LEFFFAISIQAKEDNIIRWGFAGEAFSLEYRGLEAALTTIKDGLAEFVSVLIDKRS